MTILSDAEWMSLLKKNGEMPPCCGNIGQLRQIIAEMAYYQDDPDGMPEELANNFVNMHEICTRDHWNVIYPPPSALVKLYQATAK